MIAVFPPRNVPIGALLKFDSLVLHEATLAHSSDEYAISFRVAIFPDIQNSSIKPEGFEYSMKVKLYYLHDLEHRESWSWNTIFNFL